MPKILIFTRHECGPSAQIRQALKKADVDAEVINIESDPNLALKYKINALPTTLIIEGDDVVREFVGYSKGFIDRLKEFECQE